MQANSLFFSFSPTKPQHLMMGPWLNVPLWRLHAQIILPWQARSKPYISSTRLVPVPHLCRQNLLLHYDPPHSTSAISKILTLNFSKHPIASCHSPPIACSLSSVRAFAAAAHRHRQVFSLTRTAHVSWSLAHMIPIIVIAFFLFLVLYLCRYNS